MTYKLGKGSLQIWSAWTRGMQDIVQRAMTRLPVSGLQRHLWPLGNHRETEQEADGGKGVQASGTMKSKHLLGLAVDLMAYVTRWPVGTEPL